MSEEELYYWGDRDAYDSMCEEESKFIRRKIYGTTKPRPESVNDRG